MRGQKTPHSLFRIRHSSKGWLVLAMVALIGGALPPGVEAQRQQDMAAFIKTESARKISPTLQRKLLDFEARGASYNQRLELILGLTDPLTPEKRSRLEAHGVLVRSMIGTVATVTASAGSIPAMVKFDFVERVELPSIVRPKGGTDENE